MRCKGMFCAYCGSQLKENDKFCLRCGKPVERLGKKVSESEEKLINESSKKQIGIKEVILAVFCVILLVVWSDACFSNLSYTRQLFDLLGESEKMIGMILYLGLYALMVRMTISILWSIKTGKYKVQYAVELLSVSLLLKIADMVVEMSLEGLRMVVFRTVLVYESIWEISLVLSVVICLIVYSQVQCYRENR